MYSEAQLTSNVTVGDVGTGGYYPSPPAVYSNPDVNGGNSFFVFMYKDTGGRVARVAYDDFDRTQTLSFDYATGHANAAAYVYAVIDGTGGRQIYLTEALTQGTPSATGGNTNEAFTVTARESFSVDLGSSTDWYATTTADFLTGETSGSVSDADMMTAGSASAFVPGEILEVGFINRKGDNGWSFAVDNVSVVPEPATMSLLAFGGIALLRRKRR